MDRITRAFESLLIKSKGEINSRIEQVAFDIDIRDTKAKGYCYCLKIDSNGNLRLNDLVDLIDENIVDYAIPRKELDEAKKHQVETGSTAKILRLRKRVTKLFTNLEKTGEGGEILLYILVQEFLKLPQLISKMSLKTSGQLHYQGADGIHVKYDETNSSLNLYWGEAKMHKTINSAITECFESLKGYLLDPLGYKSTQERDVQLITSNINANVNNPDLEKLLVRYFDKDDDLSNKLVYKGVCFIGFDSNNYPTQTLVKTTTDVKEEILEQLSTWEDTLSKTIKSHPKLELKEIHVFLIPFPSVEEFRKYYLETIK
jgi:uncharacterized protein DUF1837